MNRAIVLPTKPERKKEAPRYTHLRSKERSDIFVDRADAGRKLAQALEEYKGKDVVVYALPRGGVVTGIEVANYLKAPLDLIIVRKIGHPYNPEYALAAVAENGHMVRSNYEDEGYEWSRFEYPDWLAGEARKEREEAARRRRLYLAGRKPVPVKGKIAILVDDGIATGLTMRAAIQELKHRKPARIVVAVPVAFKDASDVIIREVDEFISLYTDAIYFGSVGQFYDHFAQVTDDEVVRLMKSRLRSSVKNFGAPKGAFAQGYGNTKEVKL